MAIEIERKFLVTNDSWRENAMGILFRQGYLSAEADRTLRVRLEGDKGKLTIKGKSRGISRSEYEYEIPQQDAMELLDKLCLKPLIEKTRYRVEHAGMVWEVDEFYGANEGLILAEVELDSEDAEFELPDWAGQEVSDNPRYYNSNLVKDPFTEW
ncbi:CYTH domain-containing protein [Malonomonas rubra DSM 5091]|uniref:CYTH domain-containing protein n=1 Tax=Malonomonas rubra DSM 5091 TaxID=1122189 RepID=A0A1M6JZ70_MALRU|nr:CYTH domain-containing protein [Malonomonas rubra]SHJ51996.1 CYTH domain-containing protein [Malonomonas rubra DSM 5091]